MSDNPNEVTEPYAVQIAAAIREHPGDDGLYLATELLREFGAKAYQAGRRDLVAQMVKIVNP